MPLRHVTAIAASTAQSDAGVFEFNFRDERYIPFEGAGAISRWNLRLPKTVKSFDYKTISDVILRINYTAVADGTFGEEVDAQAGTLVRTLQVVGVPRLFSLRYDFPTAWARLVSDGARPEVELKIDERHLPYFMTSTDLAVSDIVVMLDVAAAETSTPSPSIFLDQPAPPPPPPPPPAKPEGLLTFDSERSATRSSRTVLGRHTLQVSGVGEFAPTPNSSHPNALLDDSKLKDIFLQVTLKRNLPPTH